MILVIAGADLAHIEEAARAAFPREACGLLVGSSPNPDEIFVARTVPAVNVAPADRADRFEIDPAVLFSTHRALRGGPHRIVGHYHSHPGGAPVPSATDSAEAAVPGHVWLIVAVTATGKTSVGAFLHPEDAAAPVRFEPLTLRI